MRDFYDTFIAPSSPSRAKLSVHLIAQARSKELSLDDSMSFAAGNIDPVLGLPNVGLSEEVMTREGVTTEVYAVSSKRTPTLIQDVHLWKSSLSMGPCMSMVRTWKEYIEEAAAAAL